MANNIVSLFEGWARQGNSIVQLLNRNLEPVGAIYLDKFNGDKLTICETHTTEKYYLYTNGIAIFFTHYRRLEDTFETTI